MRLNVDTYPTYALTDLSYTDLLIIAAGIRYVADTTKNELASLRAKQLLYEVCKCEI